MKKLIIINGTMGAGKTAVSRELQKLLPRNVFLDGDWCWDMKPFTVNEETKTLVMNNITYLLNSFLSCEEFENVIFCWVLHEQGIIDELLSRLQLTSCEVYIFTLTLTREALEERLLSDVKSGKRQADVIERSVARLPLYDKLNTVKIDTSNILAIDAAKLIIEKIQDPYA